MRRLKTPTSLNKKVGGNLNLFHKKPNIEIEKREETLKIS